MMLYKRIEEILANYTTSDIEKIRDEIINLLVNPDNKILLSELIELAEAEVDEYARPDNQGD